MLPIAVMIGVADFIQVALQRGEVRLRQTNVKGDDVTG